MSDTNSIYVPGYPSNNRVPGVFAAVDPSKANTGTINQRSLLLGQMLSSGTALAGIGVISAGLGDARTAFGAGSQLALAVERYRAIDLTGELWVLPMADASGSAAATGSIVITGPATAPGVIPLYLNGFNINVAVNSGDTATTIAANMTTDINNYVTAGGNTIGITATSSSGTVTLTAANKGSLGNTFTINLSFMGTANGEGQPGTTNVPGVGATISAFSGGTTDPTVATALANLPDQPFDFIHTPYSDTTTLNAIQAFLGDAAGRWNWSVQLFGGSFVGKAGSLSTRTTWSTLRNDQHAAAIGAYGSPSPDWYWGVDYCAAAAVSIRNDPTIPIGGLTAGALLNVVAPPLADRDGFANRQTLLFDGLSTYKVGPAGDVHVDRAITTYQFNASGDPDNSYLNLNVPYQLMAYIRTVETMLGSQFNQVKLVADGSRIPPGSRMVTSQTILAAVVSQYIAIATVGVPGAPAGLVQNPTQFAQQAQSENAGGGIVKLLLPVQLGNQLIAIVMNVQFTQP
jgi:phage tail sheath gpL-like